MSDERRQEAARKAKAQGDVEARAAALREGLRQGALAPIELRFAARRGDALARAVLGADAPPPLRPARSRCRAGCPTLDGVLVELITGQRALPLPTGELWLVHDVDGDVREWSGTSVHELVEGFARQFWDDEREGAEADFEIIAEEEPDGIEGEDPQELTPRLFLSWWWSSHGIQVCRCGGTRLTQRAPGKQGLEPVVGATTMPPVFDAEWAVLARP